MIKAFKAFKAFKVLKGTGGFSAMTHLCSVLLRLR